MMSFSQCTGICWLYVISFIQWKWRFLCNLSFQTARYFWHLTKYFAYEGFPQCWCGSSVKQSRLHHSHVQFCLNLKITFLVLYFAGVNLICIHITPRPVLKIFFFFFTLKLISILTKIHGANLYIQCCIIFSFVSNFWD